MNIKITLNEISVGGLLLTLSHEIYSRMGVLNTECDFFGFETKMPFEWLNTHLVLSSCWQSKEGMCDPLYENCFATVQPVIWQLGNLA